MPKTKKVRSVLADVDGIVRILTGRSIAQIAQKARARPARTGSCGRHTGRRRRRPILTRLVGAMRRLGGWTRQ